MILSVAPKLLCAMVPSSLVAMASTAGSNGAAAQHAREIVEVGAERSQRILYNGQSSGLCRVRAADSEAIVDTRIANNVSGILG